MQKIPITVARGNENWFEQIQNLLLKHKSLYTDISYALFDTDIHPTIMQEANNKSYGDRILFGTDYFLTEQEQPEKTTYNNFKKIAQETALTNYQNMDAWQQLASVNAKNFLASDYDN